MEEDYVSFEQAKLLKDKGFPQMDLESYHYDKETNTIYNEQIYRPTLSLVAKWLREEKEISICVGPEYHIEPDERGIDYARRDFRVWTYYISTLHGFNDEYLVHAGNEYNTYKDALSAAIDKALELI